MADPTRQERAQLTHQWMDTAVRPDLYPPPVQLQTARLDTAPAGDSALDRARRTKDASDIKDIDDFGGATDAERVGFIRILLDQTWVGPRDEAALERIWASFGTRILTMAGRYRDLWQQSSERGAELDDLPAIAEIKQRFRADVCARAQDLLARNEAHVLTEMQALGIAEDGTSDRDTVPIEEDYLADIQEMSQQAVAAKQALKELRRVPVGFEPVPTPSGFLSWHVVTFDPACPPMRGPEDTDSIPGGQRHQHEMRAWTEVKAHHDELQAVLAALAALAPALHTVLAEDDEGKLADVAAAEPHQARRVIARSLQATLRNIRETRPKIGGDLDDRDLVPVHQQLFAGAPSASGIDWSEPIHQWAAKDLLSDHESREFWISLGLGTAAAAAFVVAELATAGTATFFFAVGAGVGISGAMTARGWEQWQDLDAAAGASAGPAGQLVSRGQADAALITAVVDSAFVFLDLIPVVKAMRTAAGARVMRTAAAETGQEGVEAGTETLLREGGEEVAQAGAGKAVQEGLEQGVETGAKRLRPEEAANWDQLQSYVGKPVAEVGPPPGYRTYEMGGRTFLRRIAADDQVFARLTVDPDGLIRAGRARPQRLGNPHRVAQNVREHLLAGKPRPPNHQAHHLVPDQVVRDHPLMRAAHDRGLFDLDDPSNLALLAKSEADQVPGISQGLPIQKGPHPTYNKTVMNRADDIWVELQEQGYTRIGDIPDELLEKAAQAVQDDAQRIFEHWIKDNGPILK